MDRDSEALFDARSNEVVQRTPLVLKPIAAWKQGDNMDCRLNSALFEPGLVGFLLLFLSQSG
jgi:hypothetical protein